MFYEEVVLKGFQNSQRNIYAGVFFKKVSGLRRALIWSLQNFLQNKSGRLLLMKLIFSCFAVLFLKSTLTFQKRWFCLLQWESFKNHENVFLVHVKSSFCSWDINIFVRFEIFELRNRVTTPSYAKWHHTSSY